MTTKPDIDWREDFLNTKARLNNYTIELVKNGATNFGQALILKEIKKRYLKMKGLYKQPKEQKELPNCQSSFKQFSERVGSNSDS